MTGTLSAADVRRLLDNPSPETRAEVAAKLARQLDGGALTPAERALAEDILRALSRDAALAVRQAIAGELKESPHLPRDVALALAHDVEVVALPLLHHAPILGDADLVAIIQSGNAAKALAIAVRQRVSESVAEAIIGTDQKAAIAALIGNDGADLSERLLTRVLERHGGDEEIDLALAQRRALPLPVLERLAASASTGLREVLAKRADLPEPLADTLAPSGRERADDELFSPNSTAAEALDLAQRLHQSGRLTPPLIVRAICLGDIAFLEAAFAVLADIPVHNARLLIYDAGPLGFKAIYERCKLPPELHELFRIALRVALQTEFDGGENDRERHRRRTLERILTQYDKLGREDLDYLLAKLREAGESAAA